MERKKYDFNKEKWDKVIETAKSKSGLISAMAQYAGEYAYGGRDSYSLVWQELTKIYGEEPHLVKTVDKFWSKELKKAVEELTDKNFAAKIPEILNMRMEGQFSESMYRRSYRSKDVGYYASSFILMICKIIKIRYCVEDIGGLLHCDHDYLYGYEYLLALELRNNNREIVNKVKDAIYGDNSEILISRKIIEAVIISGNEELIDDLMKLLLAAKQQEGLRQNILESADKGSIRTLCRILKLCIDENLFRFSSAVRAFDTWTGLSLADNKSSKVNKCANLAYEVLTDESKRKEYMDSSDNLEAYMALWGQGCYEVLDTDLMAEKLLNDEKHYRKILGWFFVSRTNSNNYRMMMAERYLEERDEEVLAWVINNLAYSWEVIHTPYGKVKKWERKIVCNSCLSADKEKHVELFNKLKEIALFIGNKNRNFTGNPFEYTSITLENTNVINCMFTIIAYDMDDELICELFDMADILSANDKQVIICNFLAPENNEKHRAFLCELLNDRSIHVKERAVERLSVCRLCAAEIDSLAYGLKTKSSSLRKAIISVLQAQPYDMLVPVVGNLLESAQEYGIQAGIEMLMFLKEEHPQILKEYGNIIEGLKTKKLTTQTEILLNQLVVNETEESQYTPENGFGLYDPKAVEEYINNARALSGNADNSSKLLTEKQIKAMLPTLDEYVDLLNRINQVFINHADYELEIMGYDGSVNKVLWGDNTGYYRHSFYLPAATGCRSLGDTNATLEMMPFYDEFMTALGVYATDIDKMLGLCYVSARTMDPAGYYRNVVKTDWIEAYEKKELLPSHCRQLFQKYDRFNQMLEIISKLPTHFKSENVFSKAVQLYKSLINIMGEENLSRNYFEIPETGNYVVYGMRERAIGINHVSLGNCRSILYKVKPDSEGFEDWFKYEYRIESLSEGTVMEGLSTEEYFRAYDEKIIPLDVFMAFLADKRTSMPGKIKILTNPVRFNQGKKIYDSYPWAQEMVNKFVNRIVEIEEKRGEIPTVLTEHCLSIERFYGAEHFCNLLAALGKESFFRGYEYREDTTKKSVLSRLLKRCYPAKDDTAKKLAAMLKNTDISDKRLMEAVMYAPQWAGFVEEILKLPGLKCGVWFFHAHINESFSAEKETETAIYSPISPQQFNDGAFDKNWFFEAYNRLGEKNFNVLYKSAKYITTGSNQHRRSQLYSDAVLNKLNAEELKAEIIDKRNQEKLRCYPLIPIEEGDSKEALNRYEFIQKFLKESKQFGAQRRESEKKACATAMENLAITTGLMDVNRLMWRMESEKLEDIRPLMESVEIDGVSIRLSIDENGDAGIVMEKGGKVIKTVPKNLAKNEIILERKAVAKELKEQKRRSKESLERSMTDSVEFETAELLNIIHNPVLAPMLKKLVWISGDATGFISLSDDKLVLVSCDGVMEEPKENLRIAHPYDLKTTGVWADYMHYLYQNKIIQPFKQVFREYYPITDDEKQEKTISRRYAGHQVQPQRTVALLKGRGWTVDYEEGLQKVFYKEDIIVRMYALADWFSPADIEAPTLETVEFFDRKNGKNISLEEIPPILFSEVMRDLDLVVSVAHVGGVDPEASHSTVEMRTAIAQELVKLLKFSNVSWIGAHAKIHGQLASYSVHMGSGVVHAEGIGMLAILPVHSQARGRIFLPFADDDPKTAEIMSKIILLAEDKKIKDPSIINQIC